MERPLEEQRFTASGRVPRLFVDAPLQGNATLTLDADQLHYVRNVMRLSAGDLLRVFNGRDGEWQARLGPVEKRRGALSVDKQIRLQEPPCDLHYLFAPLKHARLDYMVQKATELGASVLRPVLTQHTQVSRVNEARMRSNAVEAAEQCGLLSVPVVEEPRRLTTILESWPADRALVFADEDASASSPIAALEGLAGRPLAALVGPEGGFSTEERGVIRGLPQTVPVSLGPRIMRADTAAVAVLALMQSSVGDWR